MWKDGSEQATKIVMMYKEMLGYFILVVVVVTELEDISIG